MNQMRHILTDKNRQRNLLMCLQSQIFCSSSTKSLTSSDSGGYPRNVKLQSYLSAKCWNFIIALNIRFHGHCFWAFWAAECCHLSCQDTRRCRKVTACVCVTVDNLVTFTSKIPFKDQHNNKPCVRFSFFSNFRDISSPGIWHCVSCTVYFYI